MSIIQTLFQLFFDSRTGVHPEQFTTAYLEAQKNEMGMDKYPKWLKRRYVMIGADYLDGKAKGFAPEKLESHKEAIRIVEAELEKMYQEGIYGNVSGDSWKQKLED